MQYRRLTELNVGLEKTNTIDKPLARLDQMKKGQIRSGLYVQQKYISKIKVR